MKFYDISTDHYYRLLFLADFLSKRLNQKLRFGDRKSVYSLKVGVGQRGQAITFNINGEIKKDNYNYAKHLIDEELDLLRSNTMPDEDFKKEQQAVVRSLKINNTTSIKLGRWLTFRFYNPSFHRNFPDLVTFFQKISQDDISELMRNSFIPEHRVMNIIKPSPINQAVIALILLIVAVLTIKLARMIFIKPVDMTRISYVAHIKIPKIYSILVLGVFGILVAFAVRIIIYAISLSYRWLLQGIDSYIINVSAGFLYLVVLIFLIIWILTHIPRKIMTFDDHLRVKYLSYRSKIISPDEIKSVTLRRFRDIWLSRNLFNCLPLTFGLLKSAIYLQLRNGRSYFFKVRKNEECQRAINKLMKIESQ